MICVVLFSCQAKKKEVPSTLGNETCPTFISSFCKIDSLTIFDKIAGHNFFLTRRTITSLGREGNSNIPLIDSFGRKKNQVLKIDKQGRYSFADESNGSWQLGDNNIIIFKPSALDSCSPKYLIGGFAICNYSKDGFNLEHIFGNKERFECRWEFLAY